MVRICSRANLKFQNKAHDQKGYFGGCGLTLPGIVGFARVYWGFGFETSERDRKPWRQVMKWYLRIASEQ
jgi:hypothetical protein